MVFGGNNGLNGFFLCFLHLITDCGYLVQKQFAESMPFIIIVLEV
jgi:hypothetical protein